MMFRNRRFSSLSSTDIHGKYRFGWGQGVMLLKVTFAKSVGVVFRALWPPLLNALLTCFPINDLAFKGNFNATLLS